MTSEKRDRLRVNEDKEARGVETSGFQIHACQGKAWECGCRRGKCPFEKDGQAKKFQSRTGLIIGKFPRPREVQDAQVRGNHRGCEILFLRVGQTAQKEGCQILVKVEDKELLVYGPNNRLRRPTADHLFRTTVGWLRFVLRSGLSISIFRAARLHIIPRTTPAYQMCAFLAALSVPTTEAKNESSRSIWISSMRCILSFNASPATPGTPALNVLAPLLCPRPSFLTTALVLPTTWDVPLASRRYDILHFARTSHHAVAAHLRRHWGLPPSSWIPFPPRYSARPRNFHLRPSYSVLGTSRENRGNFPLHASASTSRAHVRAILRYGPRDAATTPGRDPLSQTYKGTRPAKLFHPRRTKPGQLLALAMPWITALYSLSGRFRGERITVLWGDVARIPSQTTRRSKNPRTSALKYVFIDDNIPPYVAIHRKLHWAVSAVKPTPPRDVRGHTLLAFGGSPLPHPTLLHPCAFLPALGTTRRRTAKAKRAMPVAKDSDGEGEAVACAHFCNASAAPRG
ncbi:hypothetical protein B0H19DRAFT_1243835 [Mycena capillaripes]|nr:hypothetical protein B0H19DRAFT_1243835 [Mycena capillaripes]